MNILYPRNSGFIQSGGIASVFDNIINTMAQMHPGNGYYINKTWPSPIFDKISASNSWDDGIKNIKPLEHNALQTLKNLIKKNPHAREAIQTAMYWLSWQKRKQLTLKWHKEITHCNIDVVHCPYQTIPDILLPLTDKFPFIANIHDLQHEHYPEFFALTEIKRRRKKYKQTADKSAFIIAAAEHVRKDIIRFLKVPPEKVVTIKWGAPWDRNLLPGTEDAIKNIAKYHLSQPFIIYPSVTWEHKNHLRLIKAFNIFKQKYNMDVKLILLGSKGPCHEIVNETIKKMNLEHNVLHLGVIPLLDLQSLYKLANGLIMPSLHEQTSGPIMEAMVSGCPVAGANIADHQELLDSGNCGILFDPENIDQIAESIHSLFCEPEKNMQMAQIAQQRIHEIRSWKTFADSYNSLYQQCIE